MVAVHAYEMERATPRASHALVPGLEAWAAAERQAFERVWCAPLTRSGVACRMVFRHGRAGSVLSDVARELDADLVVTGRRGLNTLAELVAGSASQYLVHRAGCPVVVVPTATPARGARPVAAAAARA